jgi:hypothetical protein
MRCPDCNKFASYDEADPEVNDIDVDADGQVTAEIRITNNCADCGTELKEATLNIDHNLGENDGDHASESAFEAGQTLEAHQGEGHELEAESTSESRDSYQGKGGRRAPTYYGAEIEFTVACSCDKKKAVATGTLRAYEQAGSMDELV